MIVECERCGEHTLDCVCHGGMAPGAQCICVPCQCGEFYGTEIDFQEFQLVLGRLSPGSS